MLITLNPKTPKPMPFALNPQSTFNPKALIAVDPKTQTLNLSRVSNKLRGLHFGSSKGVFFMLGSLFRNPSRKGQTHRNPSALCIAACLPQLRRLNLAESISFSSTRRGSLAESPRENPPTQPHRKPNPERDRLTESPHALLLVSHNFRLHHFQQRYDRMKQKVTVAGHDASIYHILAVTCPQTREFMT